MRTTRIIAAAAALVVAGSAFAQSPGNGASTISPSASNKDLSLYAYDLSAPIGSNNFNLGPTSSTNLNLGANLGGAYALPGHGDNGTIWLLTDLSYELPGDGTTVELGLGWYGLGGGINFYPNGGHHGFMISVRAGWTGSGGVAVNAAANYVGHFTPSVVWRLGIGVEYQSNSGWLNGWSDVFPIGIADVGFRL